MPAIVASGGERQERVGRGWFRQCGRPDDAGAREPAPKLPAYLCESGPAAALLGR